MHRDRQKWRHRLCHRAPLALSTPPLKRREHQAVFGAERLLRLPRALPIGDALPPSTRALSQPRLAQLALSRSSSASIVKRMNADIFGSATLVRGFGDAYASTSLSVLELISGTSPPVSERSRIHADKFGPNFLFSAIVAAVRVIVNFPHRPHSSVSRSPESQTRTSSASSLQIGQGIRATLGMLLQPNVMLCGGPAR